MNAIPSNPQAVRPPPIPSALPPPLPPRLPSMPPPIPSAGMQGGDAPVPVGVLTYARQRRRTPWSWKDIMLTVLALACFLVGLLLFLALASPRLFYTPKAGPATPARTTAAPNAGQRGARGGS